MNLFTQAVDFLQQYVEATDAAQEGFPNIETGVQYALKILKSHQDYDGPNETLN